MEANLLERKASNNAEDGYISESVIVYSRKKKSKFKEYLVNTLFTFDKKPFLLSLSKLLFGFGLLACPSIALFLLIYLIIPTPTKYLTLPFIISIGSCTAFLSMLLIVKLGISCKNSGILISSWERQALMRIFSCIIFNCFLIGALMHSEQFCLIFPIFQGNIGQMDKKEFSARELVQGSFIFRVLFLNFFWDFHHSKLGYFDLTKDFLKEFRTNLNLFNSSILTTTIYYLIKVIFVKSKNTIIYISICLIVIYESFLFMFYPIGDDFNYLKGGFFYKYSNYFELIPFLFVIIGLILIAFKIHILALVKDKLYSYKSRKKDKSTIVIAIASFIIIIIGLGIVMYVLFRMLFVTIERKNIFLI